MLRIGTLTGSTIVVELDDHEAAASFVQLARDQNGFMIGLSQRPQPFAVYTLVLQAGAGFELRFEARVVQIFEQGGDLAAALQLEGWSRSKELELERKVRAASAEQSSPAAGGEARGASPIHRIRQLDAAEKNRLAMKANRAERQILCRDSSPQVLLGLLANPRVEATDVLQIVKSTHASAGVLQRVAKDRRWSSNSEIQTALVRNPKTPTPIAIQLLESVPTSELRQMARMGSLRENVRRAAFRVYSKRTGGRR